MVHFGAGFFLFAIMQEESDAVFTVNDAKDLKAVMEALRVLGFTPDEISALYSIVGAVLHLGNVTFSAQGDVAKITDGLPISIAAKVNLLSHGDQVDNFLLCLEVCFVLWANFGCF